MACPYRLVGTSEKQSILEAMEHLLARQREIRPLFLASALPIKEEWYMSPYFGVFPFVFKALKTQPLAYRKSAFSAPRICTVDAGYFDRFVRLPA